MLTIVWYKRCWINVNSREFMFHLYFLSQCLAHSNSIKWNIIIKWVLQGFWGSWRPCGLEIWEVFHQDRELKLDLGLELDGARIAQRRHVICTKREEGKIPSQSWDTPSSTELGTTFWEDNLSWSSFISEFGQSSASVLWFQLLRLTLWWLLIYSLIYWTRIM